jgi:uncharacterized protein YndB with AHSA1/START domain
MPDIMHLINIHATPTRVYEALTTDEGIRNWWTRDADLDSRIGGTGEFRFYEGKTVTKIRVDELNPSVRVGWTTVSSAAPGGWKAQLSRSICARRGTTRYSPLHIGASRKATKATRV